MSEEEGEIQQEAVEDVPIQQLEEDYFEQKEIKPDLDYDDEDDDEDDGYEEKEEDSET